MSDREAMKTELKRVVQPHLRAAGFSGSFPHYRKIGFEMIDLLSFQFDRNSGGFVIEIARCRPDGIVTAWGAHVAPAKTSASNVHPNFRKRIQPKTGGGTDSWFRFDNGDPSVVAADVLRHLSKPGLWSGVELQPEGPVFER